MCGLFERERMRENKLASTAGKMIQVKKKATIRTSLLTKKQAHVHVRNVKLEFQEEKEEKRENEILFRRRHNHDHDHDHDHEQKLRRILKQLCFLFAHSLGKQERTTKVGRQDKSEKLLIAILVSWVYAVAFGAAALLCAFFPMRDL